MADITGVINAGSVVIHNYTITVSDITGGHRLTVLNNNTQVTQTMDVLDGAKGDTGNDGVSPTVAVSDITGGHRLTITDATGTRTADVMDGDTSVIANAYSASSTYAVGDICIYSAKLYKCVTAITTAEAWTAAHWSEIVVGDEITEINCKTDIIDELKFPVCKKTVTNYSGYALSLGASQAGHTYVLVSNAGLVGNYRVGIRNIIGGSWNGFTYGDSGNYYSVISVTTAGDIRLNVPSGNDPFSGTVVLYDVADDETLLRKIILNAQKIPSYIEVSGEMQSVKNNMEYLYKKADVYYEFSYTDFTGSFFATTTSASKKYIALFEEYATNAYIGNVVNSSWYEKGDAIESGKLYCVLSTTVAGEVRINSDGAYTGKVYLYDVTGNDALLEYLEENGVSGVGGKYGLVPDMAKDKDVFDAHIAKPDLTVTLSAYTGYSKELLAAENNHTYIAVFSVYDSMVSIRNLVSGWQDIGNYMTSGSNMSKIKITAAGSLRLNTDSTYTGICYLYDVTDNAQLENLLTIKGIAAKNELYNCYAKSDGTIYYGKKLTTYGDSITSLGGWQDSLLSYFGFSSIVNKGIGGTRVSVSGDPTGTNAFCDSTRVATIDSNSDFVIIMGGTNDCGQSVELGDLTYSSGFDTSKFKGALATTIRLIQSQCANAQIFVASPLSGRGTAGGANMNTVEYNSIGLTTYDYAKACKEVAEMFSIPYIPIYEECRINPWNRLTYISDTVHPNAYGKQQIANVFISHLEKYVK